MRVVHRRNGSRYGGREEKKILKEYRRMKRVLKGWCER